jgi:hypothetical protein
MKVYPYPDVVPGQVWRAGGFESFVVRAVVSQGDGTVWVEYENPGTGQQYSCLIEAFQHRFSLFDNN